MGGDFAVMLSKGLFFMAAALAVLAIIVVGISERRKPK